jgi:hypothetical protein
MGWGILAVWFAPVAFAAMRSKKGLALVIFFALCGVAASIFGLMTMGGPPDNDYRIEIMIALILVSWPAALIAGVMAR